MADRESRLGRLLWHGVLVVVLAYAAGDFVQHPVIGSAGSAAEPGDRTTLWLSETDAAGQTGGVARDAARLLRRDGDGAAARALDGGAAAAIERFFGRHGPDGRDVLVVSGTTLADLARERSERLTPAIALRAASAQALLREAAPIGAISGDRLALATRRDSGMSSVAELLDAMRAAPRRHAFSMLDDTWSRAAFAALVERAREQRVAGARAGRVPFSTASSPPEAMQALRLGRADVLLGTRANLDAAAEGRRPRVLRWPRGERAPRWWVALLANPRLSRHAVTELRAEIGRLARNPAWGRALRTRGARPARVPAARFPAFLAARADDAARLQRLADRIEAAPR